MEYKKWKMAKENGINLANCYHFGEDTSGSVCGAMAVWFMPMPGDIPDMPLCRKHRSQYRDITTEDVMEIIMNEYSADLLYDEEDDDES